MTPIQQLAAIEIEKDVLSLMMSKPYIISQVRAELKVDDFFRQAHRLIYSCLLDMYQANAYIDYPTIVEALRERGDLEKVGSILGVSDIFNKTLGIGGVDHCLELLKERAKRKHAIEIMDVAVAEAADISHEFDLHDCVSKLAEVMKERYVPERSVKDMFSDLMQNIERRATDDRHNVRMMTGIAGLDSLTHGFGKKDLILIAARPSMGKSALAGQIALNAVVGQGLNVLYASLEMSEEQILGRMLANMTDIDSIKILHDSDFANSPDYQVVKTNAISLSEVGLFIRDVGMTTPDAIYTQAQQIQARHGLDAIIIDHMHLMRSGVKGEDSNQYAKMKTISGRLKEMAKEFDIPIVALAQLSRGVEQRNDKHPLMSDLRDAGSLEEDADKIIMMYREQYYSRETLPVDIVEISVKKNRMGEVGSVSLEFQKQFSKFKPLVLGGTAEPKGFKPPV
jgi:replicative DNA helicase